MSVDQAAAVAETHISVLFFLGDRAYKLKKPVDLGFLDFTTRKARLEDCRREVELNRRLAPDVYLGVADVTGPDGELADHLVVMRRMPADRRLATLVEEGDPAAEESLRPLARQLARFHSEAQRGPEVDAAATVEAVRANWEESFEQIRAVPDLPLDLPTVERVESLVRRYLDGREALFDHRIAGGHVCDGHGDLQAADVFVLDDGPRVLDCIEFNDRFRHGDVLADVAFLAMDLDRLGAPDLGAQFLDWYREFAAETAPSSLVEHYVAYRAHVRCKVGLLRAVQLAGPDRAEAVRGADRLLHMTLRYLDRARVRLVLVGGLPGTGKTTLASALGERLRATVLRSDVIRKELAGLDSRTSAAASYGEGLYDPETTAGVYAELARRAEQALRGGVSVVLDASWTDAERRRLARELADETVADLAELECQVPAEVAAERLRDRAATGTDASDATPDVARRLAAEATPWPEAVRISTVGSPADSLAAALGALGVGEPVDDVVP